MTLNNQIAEKINSGSKLSETLTSAILEPNSISTSLSKVKSEMIEKALTSHFNSDSELTVKKILAAALFVGKKKGILPMDIPNNIDSIETATLADEVINRIKTSYQTANGIIDAFEAADILIDKATARVMAVADMAVEKGIDFAINKLSSVVAKTFPQAIPVIACVKVIQPVITEKAQQIVRNGIGMINKVAKNTVRTLGESVKTVVKNTLRSMFTLKA